MRVFSAATSVALLLLLLVTAPAAAQRGNNEPRPSPNAGVSQTIGTTVIDVEYGRPGVKGREIYGGLVPWGEVWRAGANEPTTIVLSGDVQVEGEQLAAGTYNIFVRPSQEGAWDVIFTEPVRWGTMFNEANPVLEISAAPREAPDQEWLSYRFEDPSATEATLVMHWAGMELPIEISVPE